MSIQIKHTFLFFFFVLSAAAVCAQHRHNPKKNYYRSESGSTLYGKITDADGNGISGVDVYLQHGRKRAETDSAGNYTFSLPPVPDKKWIVFFSKIGYTTGQREVTANDDSIFLQNIILSPSNNQLKDVAVTGTTAVQQVRESPYNVVALDAKAYYNSTLDLAHLLDKSTGVTIRENGGLGSGMSISLNGFTGRQIKLFMDGVPMENFGSAFQLNNIPVGVADRIEIYKGVVPIELGGDAMGGAINIVTKKMTRSYADISYSYGSFNTHKTNIDLGYTAKSGFTAQLNAFQNYSDNDYKVYTQVLNLQTNAYSLDSQWVKRFNDEYHNETVIGKIGWVKTKWADRFMLSMTLGQEHAGIQNANIMRIAYGQKRRLAHTVMPALIYSKHDFLTKGLTFNFNASYNKNYNKNIDTARRQYNWLGEWVEKSTQGEGYPSMSEYNNKTGIVDAGLIYHFAGKHTFAVNNMYKNFRRKATDAALVYDDTNSSDSMPRHQSQNVLGASYRFEYNKHWNVSAFGKYYGMWVTGPVDTSGELNHTKYTLFHTGYHITGYGAATTYLFNDAWQVKASYERTYRLPTENELFGDGNLERGDASLKAEHSNNYNLGFAFNDRFNEIHGVFVDVSLMYRDVNDFIRRITNDSKYGTAYYTNQGKVSNKSINAQAQYFYKRLFSIGANITYQNIRNKQRYQTGTTIESSVYNDRMPNIPYLFGGTDVNLTLHDLLGKGNQLIISENMDYIHEFYLGWPSQGSATSKNRIPTQISHNASLTYILKNGRYNIGFEARNITNRWLYDNFGLQKPGRNFSIKFRYYIQKL